MSAFVRDVDPSQSLLNAALDLAANEGRGTIRLCDGEYTIPAIAQWPSRISIKGKGSKRTRIRCEASAPLAPDDPANAILRVACAPLPAVMDTHLTDHVFGGEDTIVVDNPGTIAVGSWLRVYGDNVGADEYLVSYTETPHPSGYAASYQEIRRVVEVNGNTLRVHSPFDTFHAKTPTGQTAHCRVVAIDAPPEGVSFSGFELDGNPLGSQVIANGITFDGAIGASVHDVAVHGFSRAGVEFRGGTDTWSLSRLHVLGQVNQPWRVQSTHHGRIRGVSTTAGMVRNHAVGKPLGCHLRDRPVDVRIEDMRLRDGGGMAFSPFGGHELVVRDIMITGWDLSPAFQRCGDDEILGTINAGIVHLGGSNVPKYGEYTHIDADKVVVRNCKVGTGVAIYLADMRGRFRGKAINVRRAPTSYPDPYQGEAAVELNDLVGDVDIETRGFRTGALVMEQGIFSRSQVRIRHEMHPGNPQQAQSSSQAFDFRNQNTPFTDHGGRIVDSYAGNTTFGVKFAPSSGPFGNWNIRFEDSHFDSGVPVRFGRPIEIPSGSAFPPGTIVQADPAVALPALRAQTYVPGSGLPRYRITNGGAGPRIGIAEAVQEGTP